MSLGRERMRAFRVPLRWILRFPLLKTPYTLLLF